MAKKKPRPAPIQLRGSHDFAAVQQELTEANRALTPEQQAALEEAWEQQGAVWQYQPCPNCGQRAILQGNFQNRLFFYGCPDCQHRFNSSEPPLEEKYKRPQPPEKGT